MALWIDDLQSFLNISAKMNRFQIIETCSMILEDFYALNLADVRLVMTRAKKGQYGALYGRLDGQIVYQWFAKYFDERCAECGRTADAEAKVRDSQLAAMSPEQKRRFWNYGANKKITKMKQETKATIAYLAAIIFVIICIALMAVTPAYGQNQTVIKDSKGEVVYVKIKTASGYIVKDKNGVLLYTVVENDTEKRVYDASGRLISVEKKAKN